MEGIARGQPVTLEDAYLEIDRLRRRVEQERRGREEADRRADAEARQLYARQRQLQLLHDLTVTANSAASFDAAIAAVLGQICAYAGWQAGHTFAVAKGDEPALVPTGVWHFEGDHVFDRLREATSRCRMAPNEGLPGRVYASRKPVWIPDIAADDNFPRRSLGNLGVRAAFGFPVLVDRVVVAVCEFFSDEVRLIDRPLIELTHEIGVQLSRLFERQRVQEALEEAAEAAAAGNRAKSDFLATVSHEIRTPMNGVIGFTNLLLDTPLTPQQREYVETIQRSGENLLTIINDVLDFSKIEAQRLELDEAPFEPRVIAEEAAELLAREGERKGVEIALHVDAAVPAIVLGDAGRIRQILFNLIGNAVKFTDKGHVLIEVRSLPSVAGVDRLRLAVTDTGIGIPLEKQSQIFGRFTQADASTTRQFGGTGLGLAIAKGIVEQMGGNIGVESLPGKGSTFWCQFPIRRPDAGGAEPVQMPSLTGVRALVVDDLEVNRRVLDHQLRAWGVEVHTVAGGAEALAALRTAAASDAPYQVALLDYLMPRMDGDMLAREIQRDPTIARTPLIMVTSGAQRGDESRFLAAGFSAYLVKPVARPRQLADAMAAALAGAAAGTGPVAVSAASVAAPEVTPALPAPPSGAAPMAPAVHQRGLRVLLAEDNAVNQRLATLLLKKLGCSVDVAGDGREAVHMFRQLAYDCVLMDCQMPNLDGYGATREIRSVEGMARHTPIIAITANAMSDDRARCLAAGMDDYLSKPLKVAELEAALHRWGRKAA